MRLAVLLVVFAALTRPVVAQSEDQLRSFFEGRSVVVKIEMPGSEAGVDVYPGTPRPIDFPKLASRLKQYGTALRRGDEVLVTKVKVKQDLIEFQLAGGGYGTFGDDASSHVNVPFAPKTEREKTLEKQVDQTTDPAERRRLHDELDRLRSSRERENARNQARAAEAQQIKEANIRQRRLEGGSRFNLRYKPAVPADALSPQSVMDALADYVDFSPLSPEARSSDEGGAGGGGGGGGADLRKGLTVEAVDALLGRPEAITHRMEGTLDVSTSVYRMPGRTVKAEFVEGVLIRFVVTSQSP